MKKNDLLNIIIIHKYNIKFYNDGKFKYTNNTTNNNIRWFWN